MAWRVLYWLVSELVLQRKRETLMLILDELGPDFRKRFIALLSYKFREFASVTALSILEATSTAAGDATRERRRRFYFTANRVRFFFH